MLLFYAAADVAFVAGSLIPHGGHNVLEPAALGMAIITGPHVFNFTAINDLLTQAHAILLVRDQQQLAAAVIKLFREPQIRQTMGRNASQVLVENRGALDKHLQTIDQLMTVQNVPPNAGDKPDFCDPATIGAIIVMVLINTIHMCILCAINSLPQFTCSQRISCVNRCKWICYIHRLLIATSITYFVKYYENKFNIIFQYVKLLFSVAWLRLYHVVG